MNEALIKKIKDGVYYFDLRPKMKTDEYLQSRIKSFDHFIIEDMWNFM